MKKKLYIVAGDFNTARKCATFNFKLKRDEWVYVSSIETIMGIYGFDLVFCGNAREHSEYKIIFEYVDFLVKMGRVHIRTFEELFRGI